MCIQSIYLFGIHSDMHNIKACTRDPMSLYRKQEAVQQNWFAKLDLSVNRSRLRWPKVFPQKEKSTSEENQWDCLPLFSPSSKFGRRQTHRFDDLDSHQNLNHHLDARQDYPKSSRENVSSPVKPIWALTINRLRWPKSKRRLIHCVGPDVIDTFLCWRSHLAECPWWPVATWYCQPT